MKCLLSLKATTIIVLITVLCVCNLEKLNAQIFIGPKAGASFNWMQYDDFAEKKYKKKPFFGYTAGIATAFQVQKRFLLQVDLMYSQKGKKINGKIDPSFKNYAKYHFLNIPIVYKLHFKEAFGDRAFKWYVGVGPNVNFWLGGKGTVMAEELKEEGIEKINYKIIFEDEPATAEKGGLYIAEANRVQVGLIFSSGIVLDPAPGQSIIIDFRYEWGHSFMAREKGVFTGIIAHRDDLRARNQAVQISVAYVFDIINKGKKERKMYYENK